MLRSSITLVATIIYGTMVVSSNTIFLPREMVGLRCGLRKVQGDVGISHCIRNQGASKTNGVMSKITGASSEELPVTKIVAVYAGGNNYYNCWNYTDFTKIRVNDDGGIEHHININKICH